MAVFHHKWKSCVTFFDFFMKFFFEQGRCWPDFLENIILWEAVLDYQEVASRSIQNFNSTFHFHFTFSNFVTIGKLYWQIRISEFKLTDLWLDYLHVMYFCNFSALNDYWIVGVLIKLNLVWSSLNVCIYASLSTADVPNMKQFLGIYKKTFKIEGEQYTKFLIMLAVPNYFQSKRIFKRNNKVTLV